MGKGGDYMAKGQGRSSGQGVKLLIIRDYLRSHATKEHPKNAKAITKYLSSKWGIEASEKTIYNDILRLQMDFQEPIEYNASKWGYYITELQFEPYELRLMVDSVQASKFITQRDAERITNKIKNLADVYTKESLSRTAYVADRVRSRDESIMKEADKIHQAIAEGKQIGFRYFHYAPDKSKKYSKGGENFVVSPYALHWENGNYYLYAYVNDEDKFRSFRIDRMDRISSPLPVGRLGIEKYKKEDLTRRNVKVFQMYHGEKQTVRMRFRNHLASAVIDEFGKDVMLIPADEGHFNFVADIEISPPFFAWISTFGRGARILSPEPVVKQMREFVERLSQMYKNDGEK